jgi:hypothetical protein
MNPLTVLSPPVRKRFFRETAASSLVKVTLGLGLIGFCMVAVLGLVRASLKPQPANIQQTTADQIISEICSHLRAEVPLPPGQATQKAESGFKLHGHWAQVSMPDTLFFSNDAQLIGGPYSSTTDPPAPAGAVFRAKITYLRPLNASTYAANVQVSWPAQVIPATDVPAGQVETFIAVNR